MRTQCHVCQGDGYSGHECGEDCRMCIDPEQNLKCTVCGGAGFVDVSPDDVDYLEDEL